MNHRILLTLVFMACLSFAKAQDSLVTVATSIEREEGRSLLSMSFSFSPVSNTCDTCKKVFDKFFSNFGSATGPPPSAMWDLVLEKMKNDPRIQLYITIPDEVQQIIALIKKEKKREEARNIYRASHADKAIGKSSSSSVSTTNGKMTQRMEQSCDIAFTATQPIMLSIPPQKFFYNGLRYHLAGFTLTLH